MSNRELVIDLVNRLPADTSLEEIARKIAFMAGVNEALIESERGEGISIGEARRQIDLWTSKSS
jgi:hypothetical protein